VAVQPHLGRIGEVRTDLDEARAELGVEDVEVVDPHPALGLVPVEPHTDRRSRLLGGREHPLELLGGHDGNHAEATFTLGFLQMGTHVVELAVVEASPVRLLQMKDGDVLALGEALHVGAKPVPDLLDDGRGGDGLAQVFAEPLDLTAHLKNRHIRVQVEPIDALELESDMTVEDIVDVHHVRHGRRDSARGPALPDRQAQGINGRFGGGPGGGPDPLPLML